MHVGVSLCLQSGGFGVNSLHIRIGSCLSCGGICQNCLVAGFRLCLCLGSLGGNGFQIGIVLGINACLISLDAGKIVTVCIRKNRDGKNRNDA